MTTTPAAHPRADRRPGAADRREPCLRDPGAVRGFHTPVRGHAFAGRPPGGAVPPDASDAPVRLVREGDNPVDGLAVAVWVTAPTPWRIGYLDRVVAARIAPLLDAGRHVEARLAGRVDAPGGWERPLVALTDLGAAHEAHPGSSRSDGLWGRPPGVRRRTVRPR